MGVNLPSWEVRFDLNIALNDGSLLAAIYRSEALASVIHGIPLPPATREQLNHLNIIRAVRGTTGIEGSDLSEDEVRQVLDSRDDEPVLARPRAREEREVRNANRVMEFVAETLRAEPERPLSEAMIGRIHELTTEGIDYENNVPGRYRTHAVSAGDYVPPRAGEDVRRLMTAFVEWLNNPPATNWPPLVRALAAHFYFISIHPFGDGNGRTARAIESYLLYQARLNRLGFFSLANFYYRERAAYIAALDEVRFRSGGDLTPFIRFAADGLLQELKVIASDVLLANRNVAFRDYVREFFADPPVVMHAATRRRLEPLVMGLMLGGPVPERALRSGSHPLAAAYSGPEDRKLGRDLAFLEEHQLVVRRGGVVQANFALMERYMEPPGKPAEQ